MQLLEKKIEEIDARDDLTTEEKTAAKAENKANEAKEAIDAADTDIKVDVNSISGLGGCKFVVLKQLKTSSQTGNR